MLFKIIGIGLTGAVLSVFIKQYRLEAGVAISVLTGAIIIGICLPYISALTEMLKNIGDTAGINSAHIKIVLKIIGVAYICQFASDICRDAGESGTGAKIELGGKVIIMGLSMPIIYNLLELVSKIIKTAP